MLENLTNFNINYLELIVATFVTMQIGNLWYSKLFDKVYLKVTGITK